MTESLLLVLLLSEWLVLSGCLQYHFVDRSLTWTEAQTYCRATHTDMVTVQSPEEMDQLIETLSSAGYNSTVWLGLYNEIEWKWSDGYTGKGTDYRDWMIPNNEPNFISANQFCVCAGGNGGWWDAVCESGYPVLCYKGTPLDPEYVYVNEVMSWSGAQSYCRENFIDLATVRNNKESRRAQSVVPDQVYPWIGLYRDRIFNWSDGGTFLFSNWEYFSIPISSLTVICGVTSVQDSGKWKLVSCETQLPFVCYSRPHEKKQAVKLRVKTDMDLNDPALQAGILRKLQERLVANGVGGVVLRWSEQPKGGVFRKENEPKVEF